MKPPEYENWYWRGEPSPTGPVAIVDIDGVLADAAHRQHLLEWPRRDWDSFFLACGDDDLIEPVAHMVELLDPHVGVVLLTARPLRVQKETLRWLDDHGVRGDLLIMRNWGDYMAAPHFKALSVEELRTSGYEPVVSFDDDPRNVAMFEHLGVPCVYIHSGYHP